MPSRCTLQTDHEAGRTVFRLAGILDRASAAELGRTLDGEAGELVLDFSLVREFADLGVATLAHALADGERHLVLRGLRRHQLRMFRYFGLDVGPAPAIDDGDPEAA